MRRVWQEGRRRTKSDVARAYVDAKSKARSRGRPSSGVGQQIYQALALSDERFECQDLVSLDEQAATPNDHGADGFRVDGIGLAAPQGLRGGKAVLRLGRCRVRLEGTIPL